MSFSLLEYIILLTSVPLRRQLLVKRFDYETAKDQTGKIVKTTRVRNQFKLPCRFIVLENKSAEDSGFV